MTGRIRIVVRIVVSIAALLTAAFAAGAPWPKVP
jgi:hypothetical protein